MPRTPIKIVSPATLRAKHVGYVLANGVRCIIVQDPNAKIPAAAMSIAAGQLNDPPQLPGLAHFCEHMLFMGTEKFPVEGEYDSYISKNNGFSNAFTSDRATVYYFQVSDAALGGALERFVEFFVAPAFDESAVNREVRAVHSEDEKNHSVDYWRTDELIRSLYNPKHPRSRYGNGNETTLVVEPKEKGINLRESLKAFYAANYTSEAACIAIYSSRDPEAVMDLIEGALLRMRPGKGQSFHFVPKGEGLLRDGVLRSWINIKTVKKTRSVSIQWPVRCSSKLWRSIPSAYISHVLGHECDSSALGVLKKRDWATQMVAGANPFDDDFCIFSVAINLTIKGFHHIPDIIGIIYEYIGLAVKDGVNADVYAQMKAEERLAFESKEVSSASDHCVSVVLGAQTSDLSHCLIGRECILEDNIAEALAYAKQLTPANALVMLAWGSLPSNVARDPKAAAGGQEADAESNKSGEDSGEEGEEDSVEGEGVGEGDAGSPEKLFAALPEYARKAADTVARFHKAQHSCVQIPKSQLAAWQEALTNPKCADLKLPAVNPFIATDFTVFPSAAAVAKPEVFRSAYGTTVVRKDANHHNTFKCSVTWSPISPIAYASPLNRLYTQVMGRIVTDSLTELSYYGALASLDNYVTGDVGGPGFTVTGPYQPLPSFFERVIGTVLNAGFLKGTREKFDTYREDYVRTMEGRASRQPYEHAAERSVKIACLVSYTFEDILGAAPSATYAGYCAFVEGFLRSGMLFECFMAGNMPSAKAMVDSVVAIAEEKLRAAKVPVAKKDAIPRFRDSLDLSLRPGEVARLPPAVLTSVDLIALPPFNAEDPNVCTLLELYIGELNAKSAILGTVAVKMLSALFFNALRTKEALGYIVFAQYRPVLRNAYILLAAQSAEEGVDGIYLLSRIVAFLATLEMKLDMLCTPQETEKITAGLIQGLEKLPDSVARDAAGLCEAFTSPLGLNYREEMIEELKKLTAEDVRRFIKAFVLNSRTAARGLVLIVSSTRTRDYEVLAKGKLGKRTITLPAKRKTLEEGSEEDGAASPGADGIKLPSFEGTTSASIEVNVVESISAYRKGRAVLRSDTF